MIGRAIEKVAGQKNEKRVEQKFRSASSGLPQQRIYYTVAQLTLLTIFRDRTGTPFHPLTCGLTFAH
jgi:hypothetical protein